MNELNELMRNEFEAMSYMELSNTECVEQALKMIKRKVSKDEYIRIEECLYDGYVKAEKFGFEQGFVRGIAVAKGGETSCK